MNHLFKNAPAAEYISNYDIFSLNYDKEYESEIEFIVDEIEYFLSRLNDIESGYPNINSSEIWEKIKKEENEGREKTSTDLYKEFRATTEISSINNKLKFLEKKIASLGYSYEITDNKIDIINTTVEEINDEDEKSLSFKIALLNELGFFELEKLKSLDTKTKQYKVIKQLLGYNERDIAGNIRALNPETKSKDFGNVKYNSHSFIEEVKKLFK